MGVPPRRISKWRWDPPGPAGRTLPWYPTVPMIWPVVHGVTDPDAAFGEVGVPGGDFAAAGKIWITREIAVRPLGAAADWEGRCSCHRPLAGTQSAPRCLLLTA